MKSPSSPIAACACVCDGTGERKIFASGQVSQVCGDWDSRRQGHAFDEYSCLLQEEELHAATPSLSLSLLSTCTWRSRGAKVSRRASATAASSPHACTRYRELLLLPHVAVADSRTMRGLVLTLHGVLRLRWSRWCRQNMTSEHVSSVIERSDEHVVPFKTSRGCMYTTCSYRD